MNGTVINKFFHQGCRLYKEFEDNQEGGGKYIIIAKIKKTENRRQRDYVAPPFLSLFPPS